VPPGVRLRTVLHHGSLKSTVDQTDPDPPSEDERMYDSKPESGDQ
jgi:hypothetical protein